MMVLCFIKIIWGQRKQLIGEKTKHSEGYYLIQVEKCQGFQLLVALERGLADRFESY